MTASPYGFWTSPVTSDFVVADSIRLEQVALDGDYPMVAPEYAATRSALAKKSGLGQIAKRKSGRTSKALVETAAS